MRLQESVPQKIIIGPYVTQAIQEYGDKTRTDKTEYGGVIIRTPEGVKIDKVVRGESHEITIPLPNPRSTEKVLGSFHCHPTITKGNAPSLHDLGTFLTEAWDRVSIIVGAENICWILMKHAQTIPLNKMHLDEFKLVYQGTNFTEIAKKWNFLIYSGTPKQLQLLGGLKLQGQGTTSLDNLLKGVLAGKLPADGVVKKQHMANFRVFEPAWSKEMHQKTGNRYRFTIKK